MHHTLKSMPAISWQISAKIYANLFSKLQETVGAQGALSHLLSPLHFFEGAVNGASARKLAPSQ